MLDRPALERVARDAEARAPGLAVLTDGDTIVITSWSWGGDDLLWLDDLLWTWARAARGRRRETRRAPSSL